MKQKESPMMSLWVLIAVTLGLFVWISFTDDITVWGHTIKKGKFRETLMGQKGDEAFSVNIQNSKAEAIIQQKIEQGPDSTIRNVLVFGDSMTHYLAQSIGKYGTRNNYKVTSVTWVSSSIKRWSETDKIHNYMEKVKPGFVIISLGANDMNLKNFDKKIPEIEKILEQMDTIPYIWVGPPLWKEDKGLYPVLEKVVPNGRLFRIDEDFNISRGPDKIHPTHKGADVWADTLMRWVKKTHLPLLADVPDTTNTHQKHEYIYLQENE